MQQAAARRACWSVWEAGKTAGICLMTRKPDTGAGDSHAIDILLIVVIFRQVRPHQLTPRSALLPLVLMAAAGIIYLRSFTLGGNDLAHIIILAVAGIVLGTVSGFADKLWRDDAGHLIARAGVQ
jgi:hypothetical protein